MARKTTHRGLDILERFVRGTSQNRYWESRARAFGVRAVFNLGHQDDDIEAVTAMQEGILLPLLEERLRPGDKRLLDFGCGPGRFTRHLARLINGSVLGVDPIQHFLDMAPKGESVEYRKLDRGIIRAGNESFDVVWVCLVLGGIINARELKRSVNEIRRVLKPGGLLFLVENTSELPDPEQWRYHSVAEYQRMFPCVALSPASEYLDLGERISILAGRKRE